MLKLSPRTARRSILLAVAAACLLVPTAVFAIVDAGGGISLHAAVANQPVTVTITPSAAASGSWVNTNVAFSIDTTAESPTTSVAAYSINSGDMSTSATEGIQSVIPTEGITTLTAGQVLNGTGEMTSTSTYVIRIDKTAPTEATLESTPGLSGWIRRSVVITATAADGGGSGLKDFEWTVARNNGAPSTSYSASSMTFSADGTYSVGVRARDVAGNFSPSQITTTFQIDTNAPSTSMASSVTVGNWQSKTVTLTLSPADAAGGSGIDYAWYQKTTRDGVLQSVTTYTPGMMLTFAGAAAEEGTNTLNYWSRDKAGNAEPQRTQLIRIDITRPKSTCVVKPSYNGIARISISATDLDAAGTRAGSGVKNIYYNLDGKQGTGASIVVTATTPATHTLYYWCDDNVGWTEATSAASPNMVQFAVIADTSAPRTTASAVNGADLTRWQSQEVSVALSATDTPAGSGVVSTMMSINNATPVSYANPFKISAEGTTTINFWSIDDLGNREATQTALVRIDRATPHSSFSATSSYEQTAVVSVVATDRPSGVERIVSWIDSAVPMVSAIGADGVTTQTVDLSCSIAGTHTINWVVADFAGNKEATRSVTVHVNRGSAVTLVTKGGTLKNASTPASVTVAGALADMAQGLVGKPVVLVYSTSPAFTGARSILGTTTANGLFSFTGVKLYDKSYFAVRFDGDADYHASASNLITLTPLAQLSAPKGTSTTKYAGKTFYVSGTIKPAHSSSAYLYVKRYQRTSTGTYKYVGKTRASITYKTTYSTFKAPIKLSKGTWRLYAYMASDSKHGATTSTYWKVSVK